MNYPSPDQYPGQPQVPVPPQPPVKPKMKLGYKILIGVAAVVIVGTALQSCGQGVEDGMNGTTPEPPPIVTTEPEPEPTTPPEPEPTTTEAFDSGDYDTTMMLMEMTWAGTSEEDQDNICWGFNNMGEDWLLENFNTEEDFNEEAIVDFFEDVC